MRQQLTRSDADSSLGGVCGGIAEFFGWSSFRVRLVLIILTVVTGFVPGLVAYICLLYLMPWAQDN